MRYLIRFRAGWWIVHVAAILFVLWLGHVIEL